MGSAFQRTRCYRNTCIGSKKKENPQHLASILYKAKIISLETFCLPNKLVLFYKNQEAICTHKCTIPGALSSYWHRNFENNSIQINGISKLSDKQLDQMSLAFFTYKTITKYELVCPKDIILIVHINERQGHNKMSFCHLSMCQFSSVPHSRLTLCDPMDCSTPGLPVHHQPSELAQTHVNWVGDAIEPSHPLASPSPPAFNLSQH